MTIPRRLPRLPTATAAIKRSAGTLVVDLGGIGARPSTAALAAAATAAAAAGRASECQSLLLRMSRRRGASRRDIVSSLLASSPTFPQTQVFDLLIRTYTQSRKPREAFEAFRLLLDHRVPIPASASNALLAALSRAGWPHLTAEAYRLVLSSNSEVSCRRCGCSNGIGRFDG
ncbi:hypothetical protein PAHAL_9G593600 [Panicum hallii]|uniref:Pentacotripeptide-repeat region of PRORP domain-containing protein n=1 Tax=Panicum hallii TaxID=206008 RepID=A0A2T8I6A1_9POAL|nr:hypothetical protein PAHAL_9G593600 [Panicum hallii]